MDSYGNIYIPDVYNDAIRKINVRTPPTLNFANTQVGQTSAAQDVRIINFGNSSLTIGSIAVSSGFSLGGADTTCSTTNQVLAPGTSCVLGIEFAPTVSGNISGSIVLTDGDMNASGSQQTITLNGTNGPASQAITIASTGALSYADSSVTVDASAQTSTRAAAQPTAIVGKPSPKSVTPVINPTLVATATSGLPVSLAVTSGPATLNGNTLNISAAGVVTVQATQPGNSVYAPATPVTKLLTVNPAPLMVTANNVSVPYGEPIPALTGTLTGVVRDDGITASYTTTATTGSPAGSYAITPVLSDPNNRLSNYAVSLNKGTLIIGQDVTSTTLQTSATNVMSQSSVTLTAKVTGFDAATAGNVNFLDGSAILGTSAIDGTGTAVLSTSALTVGTHSLKASYAGTTDYAVSTSPAISEIVEDFQLSATHRIRDGQPGRRCRLYGSVHPRQCDEHRRGRQLDFDRSAHGCQLHGFPCGGAGRQRSDPDHSHGEHHQRKCQELLAPTHRPHSSPRDVLAAAGFNPSGNLPAVSEGPLPDTSPHTGDAGSGHPHGHRHERMQRRILAVGTVLYDDTDRREWHFAAFRCAESNSSVAT